MKIFVVLVLVIVVAYAWNIIFKSSMLGKPGNIVVGIIGCFVGNLISVGFGICAELDWISIILSGTLGAIMFLILFNRFLSLLQ